MSEHEWCRDTARDEAVRAAEDAAAVPAIQHRDLPEQVALLRASVADILGRVVRLEGEMDAGQEATIGSGDVFADVACGSTAEEITRLTAERDEACAWLKRLLARLAELEAAKAAPPEPRGWLTAEEREAVLAARDYFDNDDHGDSECVFIARMLKQILARSSPPRVKVPPKHAAWWELLIARDGQWRDAIREAGGEVEG